MSTAGRPDLSILYRGPLSSCNYDCAYCPFAKRRDPPEVLAADEAALARFVGWCEGQSGRTLGILFTPWGEALTRRWYRTAMVRLGHLPHVQRVAIQTNLSCPLGWLAEADRSTLALWATYHPGEVRRERFLRRCAELRHLGVRHSVGIVGRRDHLDEAEALRRALPDETYLWVNAEEGRPMLSRVERDRWTAIDPLFGFSAAHHGVTGSCCHAGHDAVSVDGGGDVRRCHFLDAPLGNLYDGTFAPLARPTPCAAESCDCHIGYVHLAGLGLRARFGPNLLERIPQDVPFTPSAAARRG